MTVRHDLADPRAARASSLRSGDAVSVRWLRRYATAALLGDLTAVGLVVAVGLLLQVGSTDDPAAHRAASGLATGALVVVGLALARAWDERILGSGPEELRRLSHAFLGSAVVLGLGGLALQVWSMRSWVFVVLPVCAVACALTRLGLRGLLRRHRRRLRCLLPVLAVGSPEAVADLVRRTRTDPCAGWQVTGACLTGVCITGTGSGVLAGVPVVGDLDAVTGLARSGAYRLVAVTPASGWGPDRLRRLASELEGTRTGLVADPALMEVAGPRLRITSVDGMPLLRLSEPRSSGAVHLFRARGKR